jgi:hypothetical protein
MSDSDRRPAHLQRLPLKSFNVAPGDIVGGMVYVMDKPLGIEEGMVGISVDSPDYRAYIKSQIDSLIIGANKNKELQKGFSTKIKKDNDFALLVSNYISTDVSTDSENKRKYEMNLIKAMMADKVHAKKRHPPSWSEFKKVFTTVGELHTIKGLTNYTVNTGMGGLLFEGYKQKCEVQTGDRFFQEIGKLIKNGDKAYMVKQDGKLLLGGTGPGFGKILKTTTGKKYLQPLLNPLVIIATGGLSAVAFGIGALAWRGTYLRNNNPVKTNSDAITEAISTKIAAIKGFTSQEIDTIEGTYQNGAPKIATVVTWSPGCEDLSGRLTGGENNANSVAVKMRNGYPVRINYDNGIIYEVSKKDAKGKPNEYIQYHQDTPGNKSSASKQKYEQAHAISEDSIYGLGESLITLISLGDRDGIGSKGQNKAIVPLDPPHGGFTHQFYGIDFGKAYQKSSPIVGTLQDDFSFVNPGGKDSFKNYSMLYDTSLRDKMKGVYLLAALRGQLTDPQKTLIANEYLASDPVFAEKLRKHPGTDPGINGDIKLLNAEIEKYKDSARKDPKKAAEYTSYATRLEQVKSISQETDAKILAVFKQRLTNTPSEIDLLDNIEKLTAKSAHTTSPDGKVLLNHIRVEREDRIPWQIELNAEAKYRLYCGAKPEDLSGALEKLKAYAKDPSELKNILDTVEISNNKLEIILTQAQLNVFSQALNEVKIAQHRGLKSTYLNPENRTKLQKALNPSTLDIPNERSKEKDEFEALFTTEAGPSARNSLRSSFRNSTSSLFFESYPEDDDSLDESSDFFEPPSSARTSTSSPSRPVRFSSTNSPNSTTSTMLLLQENTPLKTIVDYFATNKELVANHPNIKNIEALQSLSTPTVSSPATAQPKEVKIELENKEKPEQKVDVTVRQNLAGKQVQYYAPKDLSAEDFKFTATEICRLAVFSAKPNAKFDFPKATPENKAILEQVFREAVQEAIAQKIFTDETKPRLKSDPPVPRAPDTRRYST